MNAITKFKFNETCTRIIMINDEPWWIAKDVSDILGYVDAEHMTRRLDDDEKCCAPVMGDQVRSVIVINESGLYSSILVSKKPEAKVFKKWVTSIVLPSIRKTGSYQVQHSIPQTYAEALQLAADQAKKIEEQRPAVEFYDDVGRSDTLHTIGTAAKELGTGRKRLFGILRGLGILMKDNSPYQRYIEAGYFKVKIKPIEMGEKSINYPQNFVTAKGLKFLHKLLREDV